MSSFIKKHKLLILLVLLVIVVLAGVATWMHYVSSYQGAHNTSKDSAAQLQVKKSKSEKAAKTPQSKTVTSQTEPVPKPKAATSPAPQTTSTPNPAHRNPSNIDVMVNKKHPLVPLGFVPSLGLANCSRAINVSKDVVDDLNSLCKAAQATGVPLGVSSSYRSYSTQASTYSYWVGQDGKEAADTYSARPGYSEHQTGLSLDFRVPDGATLSAFSGTPQQKWLAQNGWKYGFIQRYTSMNSAETGYVAESWHYRYIGRTAAADYTKRGISSLEKYWNMPGGSY